MLWVHLIAASDAFHVRAKPVAVLAKREPPFDEYHMHKEYQQSGLLTSPQWSQTRWFTRAVTFKSGKRSKQGRPPSLRNVTLNYLLFTPLIATGPDTGTTRLPLLCYLHGFRTPPRPDALGVFTDAKHQKRLPLFVLQPSMGTSSDWADRFRFDSVHHRFYISSHKALITPRQNVLLLLLDQLLGELPVVDPR